MFGRGELIVSAALSVACLANGADGPGTYYAPKAGEGNSVVEFAARPDALARRTVAFLGGSITEMNGYRPIVMRILREKHPAVDFVEIAAGLSSTCSDSGAFRLEEDVFSKGKPDLFIVEAAVNDDQDGHFDYKHCLRGVEGAVRHVRMENPSSAIVVVLMVNRRQYDQLLRGEEPVPYAAGKAVALRYGGAVANVGGELVAASQKEGGFTWEMYRDCHPSPEGCEFAARVVAKAIESVYDPERQPIACPLPDPIDAFCYCGGRALPFADVKRSDGWNLSRPDWESIAGDKREYFTRGDALWSETPGAEASFCFRGNALGAFLTAGPDAGELDVSIDGAPFRRIALRADYGKLHYPYTQMIAEELPAGKHVAKIRVAQVVRRGKAASAIRIHRLFVNDAPCDTCAAAISAEPSPLVPFLALTGRPTDSDVARKVEALHRNGFDCFLLYGRYGLEYDYLGEEWLHMIETFCSEAERRGMKVWLYDEFAFPSGSCNMRLLKENREWCLADRGVWRDNSGRLNWERAHSREVSNVFDPEATRRFIELTHEVYHRRLHRYFDNGLITGIFSDEPGTPLGISFEHAPLIQFADWRGLDDEYAAATGGRSLREDVEAFVADENKTDVWATYSRLKAHRFISSFFEPVRAWCQKVGIESAGHLTEELCMTGGPLVQGDLLKTMKAQSLPGIDEIYTNTRKDDIEWITHAAAQHASVRRRRGRGAMVELFAIGPNDMSLANMRQMIWLEALHCVDHYFLCMEVMDHRGLKEKNRYLSPIQEGQPWHRHLRVLADEARRAAEFARMDFDCDIAVRYPQRAASMSAYRETHGAFRWNVLKGPDLRSLLAEIRSRQLDCDLVEEDESTDCRFVFKVVKGGYVEERTGKRYATARDVVDDLLSRIPARVRVYETSGEVAGELLLRSYADGSTALLNIASGKDRTLVADVGGRRTTFVLPWRGVLTLRRGEHPKPAETELMQSLDVRAFDLSVDHDNLHRILFSTNGAASLVVAPDAPAFRLVVRDWPVRAKIELDGKPVSATFPSMALPVEYRPLYRETPLLSLSPGEHRLRVTSDVTDNNYFLPVAFAAGCFSVFGSEIRPMVRSSGVGLLREIGLDGFVGDVTYGATVTVPKGRNVRLRLPSSEAVIAARWNGRNLGVRAWAPYEWTMPADSIGNSGRLELVVSTAVVNMCGDVAASDWKIWRRARDRRSEGLASWPEFVLRPRTAKE